MSRDNLIQILFASWSSGAKAEERDSFVKISRGETPMNLNDLSSIQEETHLLKSWFGPAFSRKRPLTTTLYSSQICSCLSP